MREYLTEPDSTKSLINSLSFTGKRSKYFPETRPTSLVCWENHPFMWGIFEQAMFDDTGGYYNYYRV